MYKFISLLIILTLLSSGKVQPPAPTVVGYSDVLVIVNSNSTLSKQVGEYFQVQRNIPDINMVYIPMTTLEEISGSDFNSISGTIKNYIKQKKLTGKINYIVTTQGVPLKVKRDIPNTEKSTSSSFDADLVLINTTLGRNLIGNAGPVPNPAYLDVAGFKSVENDNIYLVTRLAGYTFLDIKNLIDNAIKPANDSATFVLDKDPTWGNMSSNLNIDAVAVTIRNKGYNVYLDNTTKYIHDTFALGYTSWGSNDRNYSTYKARPQLKWSPRALAETYVSTSGRTFSDTNYIDPTGKWQSLVADLIHEGASGVSGYVYEPFPTIAGAANTMVGVNILYSRYLSGCNLAEAYYSASYYVGWMTVIVGDPKMTLK